MSSKNKGAILFVVIGILLVVSWSIFTGSFILKDSFDKIFIKNEYNKKEENKKFENTIKNIYMNYVKNVILNNKNFENIYDYLLKIDGREVWLENYGERFVKTDSDYYINEIYLIEEGIALSEKIYEKGVNKKSNYYGIIKNFSHLNRSNRIKIFLKKDINKFDIDGEIYNVEITGKVEIKYFFKGSSFPLEKIEKLKGEINVKVL